MYDGDVDACFGEDGGGCIGGDLEDGGDAVAAFGTLPAVSDEARCGGVEGLEGGYYLVLEGFDVGAHALAHWAGVGH